MITPPITALSGSSVGNSTSALQFSLPTRASGFQIPLVPDAGETPSLSSPHCTYTNTLGVYCTQEPSDYIEIEPIIDNLQKARVLCTKGMYTESKAAIREAIAAINCLTTSDAANMAKELGQLLTPNYPTNPEGQYAFRQVIINVLHKLKK